MVKLALDVIQGYGVVGSHPGPHLHPSHGSAIQSSCNIFPAYLLKYTHYSEALMLIMRHNYLLIHHGQGAASIDGAPFGAACSPVHPRKQAGAAPKQLARPRNKCHTTATAAGRRMQTAPTEGQDLYYWTFLCLNPFTSRQSFMLIHEKRATYARQTALRQMGTASQAFPPSPTSLHSRQSVCSVHL